jgi:cystathionine beta-lyase
MNFDRVIERRGTDCEKWDLLHELFGREDLLPFWVADMDFECPAEVKEALKRRVEHGILGYSYPGEKIVELIKERMKRKHGWSIEKEWIVFTPGVVPAMSVAIRALTHPGDEVILQSPVYHPFFSVIENSGCHVVENELVLDNGSYRMDTDALGRCFEPRTGITPIERRIRAMLLCSPHNPGGRVWRREELEEAGNVVTGNGAFVVSDEIHCDIILKGRHIPFSSLPEFEQNSMVCMSGSKTFNLAGLSTSFAIIPNEEIRKRFMYTKKNLVQEPNVLGLVALEAAFEKCDPWLDELLSYLKGNLELVKRFFSGTDVRVIEPEGTYLVWLDFRAFGRSDRELRSALVDSGVALNDGYLFGKAGSGFERLNIACPRTMLEEGLERIGKALERLD